MADPRAALERLIEAAASGRLDELCERHRVRILGAFGSATDPDVEDPHDLDVAVAFEHGYRGDVLALWSDLDDLCGPVELDLMGLGRARPVARVQGLVGGVPLYERRGGEFAQAQIAAMLAEIDTAWLRRLDLEVLASTPRKLEPKVIHAKLRLMQRTLDDLEELGPVTLHRLEDDAIVRYAVERMLTHLVELATGINAHISATRLGRGAVEYGESFRLAAKAGAITKDLAERLAPSGGLRNVLIHDYISIDLANVADGAALALTDHRAYIMTVARWLQTLDAD